MRTISLSNARVDLQAICDAAQKERIVVRRRGKPSVVIVGIESYDEEDLRLASSGAFWQLIEERRKGRSIPFAKVKAGLQDRLRQSSQLKRPSPKAPKIPRRRKGG